MEIRLYHNPRCAKSRQALELLRARGIEPVIVDYLKTPLDAQALGRLIDLIGLEPVQLMRTGEPEYLALGLGATPPSREAAIRALAQAPRLLQRPIAATAERAIIGRPPERVLELLPA